jgi:signal transduction histidine kinase/ligand-binding sensor domain-containing protein
VRYLLVLVLIIANTFWTATAAAQSTSRHGVFGRYQQLNWDERDGLPQNTVLAIATTRDGYLWLGTYEGAVRFDGVRFTLFNPSTTIGIGHSFVTSLLERRDGELWLATYGGGVSRLADGRFTQYAMRDGLASDFATCLFEDRRGRLWVGTDGGGVNIFDQAQGRFSAYTVAQGMPSNVVRAMVDDGNGALLVGTSRGIVRIADGRVSPSDVDGRTDVAHTDISTLAWTPDGSFWVAPMSGGLSRVDAGGVIAFGPDRGLTNDRVMSLVADDEGRMWVGTSQNGVFRYAADSNRFERYGSADGLPGVRVPVIAQGADHGLWIGTDGGLVRFKQPRVTVYTQRDGLAGDFVGGIFQDADGSVWAETGHRLTRFVNGAFQVLTTNDGVPDGRIRLASSADRLPLVFTESGLVRWARDRFVQATDVAGLPWARVAAVLEDRAGTLWLGTHDGGLIRVRDGHATQLTTKDGLADDAVEALFEDRRGRLWVGTLHNGVTRIADGQMTSWSTRDGLAANHVKVFYEDAAGTLWIGTHGSGLSRFKDGKFATISVRQGLYNDEIFQILEDDDANLWMNCNTGIWRTSVQQLNEVADGNRPAAESFAYGTADGMLSSEGVGATLAGWKMRDGSLWFPTTKGIVVIDPRRRDTAPPHVLIEGITIDRQPVAAGGSVRLTPDQENLEIQYTGLNWSRPQAIKFRYRLEGLDRDWVDAGARRTAYYSHLPPGSYTFNVIADNGEGVWSAAGPTLAIVVPPRLYQTVWFRAAIVSSLVALVWLSWRYRIAEMRRGQAAQQAFSRQLIESEERERQRIAAELHDSLGQSLLVVKNRALLGALAQQDGEARKQFDEIGATVAQTLEEVRTIAYNLRPHHLEQLGLTTTIRAMIEKMGESAGIRMSSDLDDIDGLFPPDREIIIYRIIQESVNNVIKHAHARDAHLTVRCHEDHVAITIRDDGQGFAAAGSNAGAPAGGGFGLKGLAERVQMLGGTHTIESAPGRGTTVTVRIGVGARSAGSGGAGPWEPKSAS